MSNDVAKNPDVGIIMGSKSDLDIMKLSSEILEEFDVSFEMKIVSAHRTPDLLFKYSKSAKKRGIKCIIAGAGGAAHLPGMVSALTTVPVLGVPIKSKSLNGIDSLLSIVQMPSGVPTATFAIGESGAKNASLFALSILCINDKQLSNKLESYREKNRIIVENQTC